MRDKDNIAWGVRKKSRYGVILLESLVCVMILGGCLVVVIQSLMTGMHAAYQTQNYYKAVMAGENAAFYLMAGNILHDVTGQEIFSQDGCHVFLITRPAAYADGAKIREADLNIQWKSRNKTKTLLVSTMVMGEKDHE